MQIGRLLPSDPRRRLLGTLASPFNLSRSTTQAFDASELQLARDVPPNQMLQAPELASVARAESFDNPVSFAVRDELKYTNFINSALSIGAASTRVLLSPKTNTRRVYLFIVNSHATQTLFIAFGADATTLSGIPVQPNFGFAEYNIVVPQDDIFIIASGAGTTGMMAYSNASINVQK